MHAEVYIVVYIGLPTLFTLLHVIILALSNITTNKIDDTKYII